MRLAIVSDIHGNLPALEAVFAEIERASVDAVLNLGDIASGPLWPRETLAWLMARDWPTIAGNHERQLLTQPPERMSPSDAFAAGAITEAQRAWLAALPPTRRFSDAVWCCHGTPASDLVYLLETVTPGFVRGSDPGLRAASDAELRERMGDWAGGPELVLCGHSHVPRAQQCADGPLVLNPGSVGLPAYDDAHPLPHMVECGSPHARWALAERGAGGWSLQLRATVYDHESAARRAEHNGRGDWADALRSGRVGRMEHEIGAMNDGR
ncbi:metallophosphoesterase family protein [Rivibacter subsaxonicus]|uniref:Putative phosphodiesterase n=1 Tax=Rivibacter subsaxonicus TaxID=457575 RepID=A0A4Q7VWY0_9BURK|nr:metallophosphoesterase family protein [Rivibacter subsaxonicus]RZU01153.1 putative phosphodiesterase [Rivibacter subsaxonicus]